MTDMTCLRVLTVHAHIFCVKCNRLLSRTDRRRFFAQMHRALSASGYVMSQWRGLCVVVPLHEQEPRAGRHDIVNWLMDQIETDSVLLSMHMPVNDLLAGNFTVSDEKNRALDPPSESVAREILRRVASSAVAQGLQRLQRSNCVRPEECTHG